MIKKISNFFVKIMNKYLPDPFIFALILTFVVFISGIFVTGQSALAMIKHWAGGFWNLLGFSMQMVLILVTGSAMASAPIFNKGLSKLAGLAKTPTQAIWFVSIVGLVGCWINWGFGLVLGALFSKELARKIKGVDYRLLIASAYSGLIVWHGGLSGSIPLKLAAGADLKVQTAGAVTEAIPTSQTLFSPLNIFIVVGIFVIVPIVNSLMHPTKENVVTIDPSLLEEIKTEEIKDMTPADKLENSKILWILSSALGLSFMIYYFYNNGFKLNLNIVNFSFLFIGIILHGNIRKYIDAVFEATKSSAGIILQFPFYAGIMGMMTGKLQGTDISLAGQISSAFVAMSTKQTFPFFSFLSAGIVNFFVPSGGGQWAVQGPIMMPGGASLGVPAAKTAMSIAWGDAWTNMIQPFWALPALGIAKLSAKDIMGYCVMSLIVGGIIMGIGFLVF